MDVHEFMRMQSQQQQNTQAMFYVNKELLDNECRGINALSIMEESFPRNSQGLIIIPLRQQIQLHMTPYVKIIEVFLNGVINQGYSHLIID